MDPDIRPQDDLFRHVNGRWLDTTEIPADRSVWGAFVALADQSEERVREIIEELRRRARHEPGSQRPEDRRPVRQLHGRGPRRGARRRAGPRPTSRQVAALPDLDALVAFVGGLERRGGGGFFGAYVNTDDRDADRYLVNIVQGGIGLPDESYYREEKFADIRAAYLAHLEQAASSWPAGPTRPRAAQQVLDVETRLAQGHWERAETRDVLKAYNLTAARRAARAGAGAAARHLGRRPRRGRRRRWPRRSCGSRRTSSTSRPRSRRSPLEDWKAWLAIRRGPVGVAVPLLGVRRGELRLLRPHPAGHPRAAGPLEARRRVRRGLDRRGGRRGVRRPALPAARPRR